MNGGCGFGSTHCGKTSTGTGELIPGHPENDRYTATRIELGIPARTLTAEELEKALAAEAELLERLNQGNVSAINKEFEELAMRLKREPEWYRPGREGVKSIHQIATELKRLSEYDTFYKSLSYSVHGSHAMKSLILEEGQVGVEPIRDFERFPIAFGIGINSALLRTYITMLKEYRPDEVQRFSRKFLDEWRERLRNLPTVTIEPHRRNLG